VTLGADFTRGPQAQVVEQREQVVEPVPAGAGLGNAAGECPHNVCSTRSECMVSWSTALPDMNMPPLKNGSSIGSVVIGGPDAFGV